jgi:IS30 family transposase
MRRPQRAEIRQFWLSIRREAATEEAAAALGYTKRTGTRWFGQAGGVVPAYVTAQRGRRYLGFDEREEIFAGVERGDSIRLIARSLGRAPSTVQRELRRNIHHQQYRRRSRHGFRATKPWKYRPSLAQLRAEFIARRPKSAKLATNLELRELVQAKLKERLSPQQISVELRHEFRDSLTHRSRTPQTATQCQSAARTDSRHGQHQPTAG